MSIGVVDSMSDEMKVDEEIELRHGPFASYWTVVEVRENGAVLRLSDDPDVRVVGHAAPVWVGNEMLTDPHVTWLGRAHWAARTRRPA